MKPVRSDDLADLFSDSLAAEAPPRPADRPVSRLVSRARRRLWTAVLAAVAVTGGLLPLYGDPRVTPLTHPLWARMLLRALDLEDAARAGATASEVFRALSWTESLSMPAARFGSGEGVEVEGDGVRASDRVGEVRFRIPVVRGGDYRIRCHIQGDPARPVSAEVGPVSGGVQQEFELAPPSGAAGWVSAGELHLDPGAYTAAVLLPPGAGLGVLEVSPPCLRAIEPPEGWRQRAETTQADAAVTLLQALDAEHALPPADLPIEIRARDVQIPGGALELASAADAPLPTVEDLRLDGGSDGVRAVAFVDVSEPGLYTLSAFATLGEGLSFLADGCSKSVLCPQAGGGLSWRPVLTRRFEAGRHHVDLRVGAGARVEGLRLERKRDAVQDYVATLRSMGFDPGPPGRLERARAAEAIRFLRRQRDEDPRLDCGDVPFGVPAAVVTAPPPALVAGAPQGGGVQATNPGAVSSPPQPIFPIVEDQQPASPVVPIG